MDSMYVSFSTVGVWTVWMSERVHALGERLGCAFSICSNREVCRWEATVM